jgi:hypothetical protein
MYSMRSVSRLQGHALARGRARFAGLRRPVATRAAGGDSQTTHKLRDALDMLVTLGLRQIQLIAQAHRDLMRVAGETLERQAQFFDGPVRDTLAAIATDNLLELTPVTGTPPAGKAPTPDTLPPSDTELP